MDNRQAPGAKQDSQKSDNLNRQNFAKWNVKDSSIHNPKPKMNQANNAAELKLARQNWNKANKYEETRP